jgi:hypothetical protein
MGSFGIPLFIDFFGDRLGDCVENAEAVCLADPVFFIVQFSADLLLFFFWNIDVIKRTVQTASSATVAVFKMVFCGQYHEALFIVIKMFTLD